MSIFTMGPAILFCPADRPDRYAKALERADAVILDLEDAVAPENKSAARQALVDNPLDPERTIMLAKTEGPEDLSRLSAYAVVALCETALGILNAQVIAGTRNVVALMWGAEDLVASLGGSSSRRESGTYRDVVRHSRSQVLLATLP